MLTRQKKLIKDIQGHFDRNALPLYYWSACPNFGDEIGPFIAAAETGNKCYNVRDLPWTPEYAYCTAGSLLHSLRKNNCIVWGSGFIRDPSDIRPEAAPSRVLAVRGPITAEIASILGWGECHIFGDPGLLIPNYLPFFSRDQSNKAVVIPHRSFAEAHSVHGADLEVIYPWEGLYYVAAKIRSAPLVISSSLHGLILADAYRVPWVWWRQSNDVRKGGELKFLDFFQSLDIESPNSVIDNFYNRNLGISRLTDLGNLSTQSKFETITEGLRLSMPEFKTASEEEERGKT